MRMVINNDINRIVVCGNPKMGMEMKLRKRRHARRNHSSEPPRVDGIQDKPMRFSATADAAGVVILTHRVVSHP